MVYIFSNIVLMLFYTTLILVYRIKCIRLLFILLVPRQKDIYYLMFDHDIIHFVFPVITSNIHYRIFHFLIIYAHQYYFLIHYMICKSVKLQHSDYYFVMCVHNVLIGVRIKLGLASSVDLYYCVN